MVVKPMIRSNICLNAHPIGCRHNVRHQIDVVRSRGSFDGPKSALVIGASGGYGLASLITAAFGAGAATIGLSYETAAKGSRTATAGWYQAHAFAEIARDAGLTHHMLIADAFAHATREQVIELARTLDDPIDLVVYSLAAPVRVDPDTGVMHRSTLKPLRSRYESVTLDGKTGELKPAVIEPATQEEIDETVKVMGGEDWRLWIDTLRAAGVLAPDAITVAYSYIGPQITFPLYRDGTIGRAKEHLEATARVLDGELATTGGHAWVSINKALVTKASAVIPAVPLYISILYKVMKEQGTHEGTIEQMYRLFTDHLYAADGPTLDEEQRIRLDDLEMADEVQQPVQAAWARVTQENVADLADLEGFQRDFLQMHGFGFDDVDYEADVEI